MEGEGRNNENDGEGKSRKTFESDGKAREGLEDEKYEKPSKSIGFLVGAFLNKQKM